MTSVSRRNSSDCHLIHKTEPLATRLALILDSCTTQINRLRYIATYQAIFSHAISNGWKRFPKRDVHVFFLALLQRSLGHCDKCILHAGRLLGTRFKMLDWLHHQATPSVLNTRAGSYAHSRGNVPAAGSSLGTIAEPFAFAPDGSQDSHECHQSNTE